MGQKEYSMEFRLNAQKGSSFSSTFKAAQRELSQFQSEYRQLSKAQGDISAYRKQQAAISGTESKLRTLQQQYDNIQREIQETEGFSSTLENRLLSKQEQIDRTTKSLNLQTEKLNRYGNALNEAGVDTDHLETESRELTGQMNALKKKMEQTSDVADDFGDEGADAFGRVEAAMATAGIAKGLQKIYEGYIACGKASIAYETAVTGVYKTVDGTEEQLAAISGNIKDLTREIPATTDEISAVAEAAGQLGIATNSVMEFSGVMIDLGESTNLASEEAASSLAKFSNITGTAADDYSRLGSTIVDLGNNYATTEADIVAMSTRLASAGTLAGLTEPEIMALATAMSSVGIEAEAGGTAMTQTLSAIETAVAEGSDDLEEFARIAGMSAEEFANTWQNNPIQAVEAFIAGIGNLDSMGESATIVLDNLGLSGIRQANMLKSLGLAADTLSGAVGTANKAWDENIALSVEAGKRYATTDSQLAMARNSFNNLKIAIGDVYTPTVKKAAKISNELFAGMTHFVEENPNVVKALSATVIGVTTFVGALGGYIVVTKLATAATGALTAAMAANPVLLGATAVIGGIAAITAGVILLNDSINAEERALEKLTPTTRAQYDALQDLKEEYQEACDQYGENSEEAMRLRYEVDALTDTYEANKQTLEEFVAESDALTESHDKLVDEYEATNRAAKDNELSTLALIQRLTDLATSTDTSASAQDEMKAIIAELNNTVDGLNLSYEDLIANQDGALESLTSMAKAQADQERYQEQYETYVDLVKEQAVLEEKLGKATDNVTDAQERYNSASKALTKSHLNARGKLDGWKMVFSWATEEQRQNDAAWDALQTSEQEQADLQAAYEENIALQNEITAEWGEMTGTVEDGGTEVIAKVTEMTERAQALAEAYTVTYTAAYDSITGQYALWDEADEVVATSAESINGSLESQIKYWQDYNANVQSLTDRTDDIEGLRDMISSFADGSPDSINAIAGMAAASDEDLSAMVASWQALQQEQESTATSIAELKTDFTGSMEDLQTEFEQTIEDMEVSDVAAESAAGTIQAFIDKAAEMLPQVQAAYGRLGYAAGAALRGGQGTSAVLGPKPGGNIMVQANASGTTDAADVFLAGEFGPELVVGKRGASVFPVQETQRILEAMPSSGGSGKIVSISIAPVYHLSGVGNAAELEHILAEHDDELRDYIMQAVSDASIDADRRAYA